jgi:hypothetical protein
LKPRRKYWLALPSPECCVTTRPGTNSSRSAGRSIGRAWIREASIEPRDAASVAPIGSSGLALTTTARAAGRVECGRGRGERGEERGGGVRAIVEAALAGVLVRFTSEAVVRPVQADTATPADWMHASKSIPAPYPR